MIKNSKLIMLFSFCLIFNFNSNLLVSYKDDNYYKGLEELKKNLCNVDYVKNNSYQRKIILSIALISFSIIKYKIYKAISSYKDKDKQKNL